MTPSDVTLLSVRGDAQVEVPPDLAELQCALRAREKSKGEALRVAAARLDALLAALRELGGAPRTAGAERGALTWTAYSASTEVESRWINKEERAVPTGHVKACVAVRIAVRDFALLAALGDALARHDDLHVHYVGWSVDRDNPGWKQVRAAAIDAAIQQGRDYAAALGGSLQRIEHVADVGLLGGDARRGMGAFASAAPASREMMLESGGDGAPSLDPVPQVLQAVIETRFVTSVGPLA